MNISTNQLVHISSEVIVILGLTYFLNKKISNLNNIITENQNRISQLEDVVMKQSQKIDMLYNMINNLTPSQNNYRNNLNSQYVSPPESGLRRRKLHAKEVIDEETKTINDSEGENEPVVQVQQPKRVGIMSLLPQVLTQATVISTSIENVPNKSEASIEVLEDDNSEEIDIEKLDKDLEEELKEVSA